MLPKTQGELIKLIRGNETQASFGKRLGVGRTSICRYESEQTGASVKVLNYCLFEMASRPPSSTSNIERAAELIEQALTTLKQP